jgi:hypothetical protein
LLQLFALSSDTRIADRSVEKARFSRNATSRGWLCDRRLKHDAVTKRPLDGLATLKQSSQAISEVVKRAEPAVVFISVEKEMETGPAMRPGEPFHFSDPLDPYSNEFFERFFKHRRPQRGGPEQGGCHTLTCPATWKLDGSGRWRMGYRDW